MISGWIWYILSLGCKAEYQYRMCGVAMKKKAPYTIILVVLLIGIALTLVNIGNIGNSSILNPNYIEDAIDDMAKNYVIAGNGWDRDTEKTYKAIYAEDANSGNLCLVGLIITGFSVIGLLGCFFVQMRIRSVKQGERQTAILTQIASKEKEPLEARLLELANLKEKGLISAEEYDALRKKSLEI